MTREEQIAKAEAEFHELTRREVDAAMAEARRMITRLASRQATIMSTGDAQRAGYAQALHAGVLLGFARWVAMTSTLRAVTEDQAALTTRSLIEEMGREAEGGVVLVPGKSS